MVQPAYPVEAKARGIQGNVILRVIVGKGGTVKEVHLVRGSPSLVEAAITAVWHWRYEPFVLNGSAVEVETQVTVRFRLPPRVAGNSWQAGSTIPRFRALDLKLPSELNLCASLCRVSMLSGFKQFILRGNVVDMAVGVVIGAAFGAVVAALTKDLLTPLIAASVGKPDFSSVAFTINGTAFPVGDFINAVVSFLLIAAAIYFFVVVPVNALVTRMRKADAPADPATKKCPECLSEIPIEAKRCSHCTQPVLGRAA
jgi:large conductance mechanosensitive channel